MKSASLNFRTTIAIIIVMVIAAAALRIGYGLTKKSYHVDEGITVGISNGTWLPAGDTSAYTNRWMPKSELEDFVFTKALRTQGGVNLEKISYTTSLDVHPPLYYWIYTTFRFIFGLENYVLAGVMQNMLFFLISVFLFILIVKRFTSDPLVLLISLAIFLFSSATISLTAFIRMYEQLQAIGLFFLLCVLEILFPREEKQTWQIKTLIFLGLFVSVLLGMLTQYYFLFLLFPVGIFSAIYLLIKKRPLDLLFGVTAIIAGLFLAFLIFPAMQTHLFASYRAGQSLQNLVKAKTDDRLKNLLLYVGLVSKNMISFIVWIGTALFALIIFIRKKIIKAEKKPEEKLQAGQIPAFPLFLLIASVMVFTIIIVAITAPYQTMRYVGSFMPFYALAFILFTCWSLDLFRARIFLAVAAILVTVHGVLPMNQLQFHEDYVIDKNPGYFTDDTPIVILSTTDGYNWKNMLPYMDIPSNKKVYVVIYKSNMSIDSAIRKIAKDTKVYEFYVFADDYFQNSLLFKRLGWYGFFHVLNVKLDPNYLL